MTDQVNNLFCGMFLMMLSVPVLAQDMGMMHEMGMGGQGMEMSANKATAGKGGRVSIKLNSKERAIILQEMRGMMSGTQQVVDGLANGDMKAVAIAAHAQGMQVMHSVPAPLKAKLPMAFKQMGMSMHGDFDQMGLDAESLGDPRHTLQQLNSALQKCVACHATYQIQISSRK